MKKVITYGTYDLLHYGHINLLKRAKELGDYLIVGVTTDNFDYNRGKLNVRNNVMERIKAVEETGLADQIIIEEYQGQKIDDIQKYDVDVFAIGSDWEGKFDYLKEFCDVVYLPRTEGISSTQLRSETQKNIRLGIIGTGDIAQRFFQESQYVNGVEIVRAYNIDGNKAEEFIEKNNINAEVPKSFEDFLTSIDAAYIASPHKTHYDYAKCLLENEKHALVETPFCFQEQQAKELLALAKEKNLVLMSAIKTAYCPAYRHLLTLVKSGIIGEIVDIEASLSMLTTGGRKLEKKEDGGCMSEDGDLMLLPVFDFLGTEYRDFRCYTLLKNEVDVYNKIVFVFENATASLKTGLAVKTEGCMILTGTKGYIFVPAPWWKMDYFEIRYEDKNLNKKCFYSYEGAGLRYELQDFISKIIEGIRSNYKVSHKNIQAIAKLQEQFKQHKGIINL